MKEVHGQLVKVRVLHPHKAEDEPEGKKKRPRKRFCMSCETEIFDPGKACDLCGNEF